MAHPKATCSETPTAGHFRSPVVFFSDQSHFTKSGSQDGSKMASRWANIDRLEKAAAAGEAATAAGATASAAIVTGSTAPAQPFQQQQLSSN